MADLSSKERDNLASSDFAVPGKRKLPIHDADHVRAAMGRLNQTQGLTAAEKETAKARIRAAAKRFGISVSEDSSVAAEAVMAPILMLEQTGEAIQILAEAAENNGVMRVRVPFYIGNSVATIAGFSKKVYFPTGILAETVARGNRRIADKTPGMTSYARHTHAVSGIEVPCGDVVGLEAEGSKGFATIDVNATRWGLDIQAMARANQLRAVSLRTNQFQADGGYRVRERRVNDELMLEALQLDMAGIDFAPDGAAMPTYGVEVLAAEAAVEPAPTQVPRSTHTMDEITVDGLRAEFPQVVKDIEGPLQARITELEGKVTSLIEAEDSRKRDGLLAEIATKTGKELAEVKELFADAKTDAEVATRALPLLLDGLSTEAPAEAKPTADERLRDMFKHSGRGQTIQAEVAVVEEPNIDGFAVPSN